ncbi:MAG: Ig-like domain-containing protein [Prevotellaceae bacterium]|jgi:uncharacterized protein YjdB|nr:Ig-like domain-containing protein [Prevotellaceae bacterium]
MKLFAKICALLLLSVTLITACEPETKTSEFGIAKVKIVALNKTLINNDTIEFIALTYKQITIDSLSTVPDSVVAVTWSVSRDTVAALAPAQSNRCKVWGIRTGSCLLHAAAANGISSSINLSVYVTAPIPVTSVSLSQDTATLLIGNILDLTATVLPDTASNKAVTWSSSDTSVATVSSTDSTTAVVTAEAEGTAVVTVTTQNGKTATCTVTVLTSEPEPEPTAPDSTASDNPAP